MFYIALGAALACALCNGIAAILQKKSASTAKRANTLSVGLLWQLAHNAPYLVSILLDVAGGAGQLFAVRFLPLFLVQSVIASSVVVTALIDRFVLGHYMRGRTYAAVGLVLAGLVILGLSSQPEDALQVHAGVRWAIVCGPLLLAAVGAVLVRLRSHAAAVGLAIISGMAFGGTAMSGRIIVLHGGLHTILLEPLAYAVVAYAGLGLLLFTLALQRGSATIMNAALVAAETLVPTLVGLLFLGDSARGGWLVVVAGCGLTVGGALRVMLTQKNAA